MKIGENKMKSWMIFLYGMVFYVAYLSLYQDLMGKEAYIKMLTDHWLSASFTVPIAIVLVILSLFALYKAIKAEKKRDEEQKQREIQAEVDRRFPLGASKKTVIEFK